MSNSKEVLLTSENYIKSTTPLSDSLAGKYLLPTIKICQDIELRNCIGTCLLSSLQEKIVSGDIEKEGNEAYKDLLDIYVQPYLSYLVLSNITDIVANKVVNAGVMQTDDEHQTNSYRTDKNDLKLTFLRFSDSYKRLLQEFLLNNSTAFPELKECDCQRIRENLHTAYSGGLWLGGRRGKMYRRPCKGC